MKGKFSMRNILCLATTALLASTALVQAGGVERASFDPGFLFEKGNYVELSYGYVKPRVSGSFTSLGGTAQSGNMAKSYSLVAGAMKQDFGDSFSLGLVVDQPVGANVSYPVGTGYPFAGSSATITGTQVSAIGLYRVTPAISVYGGLRAEKASGEVMVTAGITPYVLNKTSSTAYGYLVGAAYEKPEIAMRVALSYVSAIDHDFSGTDTYTFLNGGPANFTTTIPQSWQLDFQTGIAADTLLFGSVQWRDWSEFDIITRRAPDPFAADPRTELSSNTKDSMAYTLGLGRKFNDTLSGAVSVGYEPDGGGLSGNLAPTGGYTSLTLAAVYTAPNGTKVTVGGTYGEIGDATTSSIGGKFTDNSFSGVGVKVGWTF